MKTNKRYSISMQLGSITTILAVTALTVGAMVSCSDENKLIETQDPSEEASQPAALKEAPVCYINLTASIGGDAATKAVTIGNNTAISTFASTDLVYVVIERGVTYAIAYDMAQNEFASMTVTPDFYPSTATLSGELVFFYNNEGTPVAFTPAVDDVVYLYYNMSNPGFPVDLSLFDYLSQDGSKNSASNHDYAQAKMKITNVSGNTTDGFTMDLVQYDDPTKSNASFKNIGSIFRQQLSFTEQNGDPATPTLAYFTISTANDKTVYRYYPHASDPADVYNNAPVLLDHLNLTDDNIYFALIFNDDNKNEALILTAEDNNGNRYTCTKAAPASGFANSKYYYGSATLVCQQPACYGAHVGDIGKVIGADGKIYDNASAATAAGTIAEAMIAFVGAVDGVCEHGLAISLIDAYVYNATFAEATGDVIISSWTTYHPVVGGTWRLPSEADWQRMMWGYYVDSPAAQNISTFQSKLDYVGTALVNDSYYWSSTTVDTENAKAVFYKDSSAGISSVAKTGYWHVRACLAF